ncbi:hypothetical protein ACWDUN_10775 [Mycobacterium sp. NPDC003323]
MSLVNPGNNTPALPKASAQQLAELKQVVRTELDLYAEATVLIQQLACTEPGCPPVETVVAVLGTPRRSWKFTVATTDLTPHALRDMIATYPE